MSHKKVRIEMYEKIDQVLGVSFNTEKAFGSQLEEHFEETHIKNEVFPVI